MEEVVVLKATACLVLWTVVLIRGAGSSGPEDCILFSPTPPILSPLLLFDNGIFGSVTKSSQTSKGGCCSLVAVCVVWWAGW